MKKIHFLIALFAFAFTYSSCEKQDPVTQADYSAILSNTGENVILKTYLDLAEKAAALQSAAESLRTMPNQANFDAVKSAWSATRVPWEQSEGFLFGPVDQEGIDPSLDSWPVNVVDLNNVLASPNELTVQFLAQQEGTLKGFHTIEFLLWGENGNKTFTDLNDREFEYLAAATGVLAADAQKLYELWSHTGGNYIDHIIKAGHGSAVYISQKAALEEMTNALIVIADEVGNGKINDPFSQQDVTLEESRFSANSKADFADNIRSIRQIYTGRYGDNGNGQSISTIVQEKNAAVDTEILTRIDAAIAAIEGIPGTFTTAIFQHPDAVSTAQTAVRDLQATLESKLLPMISNL